MNLYKKRIGVVEAVEWTGENHEEVATFLGFDWKPGQAVALPVEPGSYAVREQDGNIRYLPPEVFRLNYEPLL